MRTSLVAGSALALLFTACSSTSGSTSTTSSTTTSSTTSASAMPTMSSTGSASSMPSMSGMASSSMPSASGTGSSSAMSSMSGMDSSSTLPTGIPTASNPAFPVGTPVVILADHMAGMKGAKGTVAAAYATTTYAVDYTPTTGGAVVKDHKWVVQQEIKDAGDKPLAVGTTVTLTASHMPGMQGARATIVQVVTTPVYAVNYQPTNGQAMVMNHLWVTQDELRKA